MATTNSNGSISTTTRHISEEIRLLDIQSGAGNDNIECKLSIVSLNNKPDYEALSYVWGTTEDPVTIKMDETSLPVTQNAAEALNYLRLPDQPRTICIDSVCIDQQDLTERCEQITIMGDIYRSAKTVVAFLGASSYMPEQGK